MTAEELKLLDDAMPWLAELAAVSPGSYEIVNSWRSIFKWKSERSGWLSVDLCKDGDISIMWTTDKDFHYALFARAFSVTIKSDGRLVNYMESALSMWIKWGYERGGIEELQTALNTAKWMHSKLVIKP